MTGAPESLAWARPSDAMRDQGPIARLMCDRERALAERRRLLISSLPLPVTMSGDVRRLVELIHERAFEPRTSVKVLRSAGAARDHNVSSRFKLEIGLSIATYITTLRVHMAMHLLRTTQWSIAEVSHTVGYEYLQTFYRDFRRIADATPGDLRHPVSTCGDECDSA